jgi:hypothetical protein
MLDTREAPSQAPQTERAARPDTRSWLQERVAPRWSYGLLAGWYGLFILAQALQPEPTTEHGLLAWIGAALAVVFAAALVATAIGLAVRQRWGLVASVGTAGLLFADSIACPLTGHHELGAFVFVQALAAVALAGTSIRALLRT